jgi:membrane protein YqaA with SNARE-associated domain
MIKAFIGFLLSLGFIGIFVLAVLDSTIFFYLPFALDALFIILVSRSPGWLPFYLGVVVAGSIIGCLITHSVVTKTSEETLEKKLPKNKFERFKRKLKNNGLLTVLITAIIPPPFPFTPFVIAASVAKFPKKKLIAGVGIGRTIRYGLEGLLAIYIGKQILRILDNPIFQWSMFGLFALAVIGSVITAVKWLRGRKTPAVA